jgi:hypothetical protein
MKSIRFVLMLLLLLPAVSSAQQYANGGMFQMATVASLLPGELPGNRHVTRTPNPASATLAPAPAPAPLPAPAFLPMEIPLPLSAIASRVVSTTSAAQEADLRMFSGSRISNVIQLNWVTLSEQETIGFSIERRSQLKSSWEMVGYVRPTHAAGNTYSFLDNLRDDGVAYYRLRQMREDGSAVVSPIVSVTPDAVPQTFSVWKQSVEPFQDYGTVSFGLDTSTEVKLTLHDRYGNLIATLLDHAFMAEGHHVLPIVTSRLNTGLYFLRLHSGNGSWNLPFFHL